MSKKKVDTSGKIRGQNFSLEEIEAMQCAVTAHARMVLHKDSKLLEKKYGTQQVYIAVSEVSTTKRTLDSIRNRIRADTKAAKSKKSKIRDALLKTGGGPDTAPTLTPYEELLTSFIPDVQMLGIPNGIDTSKAEKMNYGTGEPSKKKPKFQPPIKTGASSDELAKKKIQQQLLAPPSDSSSDEDEVIDETLYGDDAESGPPLAIQVLPDKHNAAHILILTDSQEEALKPVEIDLELQETSKEADQVNNKKAEKEFTSKNTQTMGAAEVKLKKIESSDVYDQQDRMIDAVVAQTKVMSDIFEYIKQKFP